MDFMDKKSLSDTSSVCVCVCVFPFDNTSFLLM